MDGGPHRLPAMSTLDPTAVSPADAAAIQRRLDEIVAREDVRILLAVESGSRAWGFPSIDSDLDCRFIYVRPHDWYLRLHPGRDVIETPIEGLFDVNGWDIAKALRLMLRSNAVVSEWLESPLVYRHDPAAVAGLRDLADRLLQPQRLAHHYRSIAQTNWSDAIAGRDTVRRKKYLYALRPALVLRHLRLHGRRPPMDMPRLLAETALPQTIETAIAAFIAEKRASRELGEGPRVTVFDRLIEGELQAFDPAALAAPADSTDVAAADAFFLSVL